MRTYKKLDKLKTLPMPVDERTPEQIKLDAEKKKKNLLIER
jgi:hypothetical protein